jgi:uncharacterized membrane protein
VVKGVVIMKNNDTNNDNATTPGEEAARNYVRACNKARKAAENKSMERADALFILTMTAWFLAFFSSMILGFHVLCLYLACCMGFVILGVISAALIGLAKETIATPLKTLLK